MTPMSATPNPRSGTERTAAVYPTLEAEGVIRRVSSGRTADQIVDVANEASADLIVLGTRGMTELKSLLLGGVATKVVHHATCPVLLVR